MSIKEEVFRRNVIPDLVKTKKNQTLRIWFAGCGPGQELYSLTNLLRELVPNLDSWKVSILATDVNHELVDQAQKGFHETSLPQELRTRVAFQRHDVLQEPFFYGGMHHLDLLVYSGGNMCTGVQTQKLLGPLSDSINPGGLLLLNLVEQPLQVPSQFEAVDSTETLILRKKFSSELKKSMKIA
jgi:chemotaxis methyl-accepting protein methylase